MLAKHKVGELVAQLKREPGRRTDKPPAMIAGGSDYRQVLEENETSERTAQYRQKIAEIPEATVRDSLAGVAHALGERFRKHLFLEPQKRQISAPIIQSVVEAGEVGFVEPGRSVSDFS